MLTAGSETQSLLTSLPARLSRAPDSRIVDDPACELEKRLFCRSHFESVDERHHDIQHNQTERALIHGAETSHSGSRGLRKKNRAAKNTRGTS